MHPGDAAKLLILLLIVLFLAAIALHESGHLAVFAPSYLDEGFCVSNRAGPTALQGHALSFYADVSAALLMAGLVRRGRARAALSEAALAPISKNAVSLAGHGVGHLFLAARSTSGTSAFAFEALSPGGRALAFVLLFPVWFGFMRDKRRSARVSAALAALHNAAQVWLLPTRFFFTHVLMAVLGNSAIRWLGRPIADKTRYYALEAWLVDVPIAMSAFGEAATCDAFLHAYGGHVWFDMVVPGMFAVYYAALAYAGDGAGRAPEEPELCSVGAGARLMGREAELTGVGAPGVMKRRGAPGVMRQLSGG